MINNREQAILIWLSVALIWVLGNEVFRGALLGIVKHAVHRRFMLIYALTATYLTVCSRIFSHWGMWDIQSFKAALLWLLSVGILMAFKVSRDDMEGKYFWVEVCLGGFKIAVVLEFVTQFYVFNIFIELLLIPCSAFLGLMLSPSKILDDNPTVKKFLDGIAVMLGLFLLTYALYHIASDPDTFWNVSTAISFLLPVVLTVLFIPLLWFIATIAAYENVFMRVKYVFPDKRTQRFVKLQVLWKIGFRFYELKRWWHYCLQTRPQSHEEIRESILEARFNASDQY